MLFLRRETRSRLPASAVHIDWSNPFTKGLIWASVADGPNLVSPASLPTLAGSYGKGVGAAGRCLKSPSAQVAGTATWSSALSIPAGSDYAIAIFAKPSTDTGGITTHAFPGTNINELALSASGFTATIDNNTSNTASYAGTKPELFMASRIGSQAYVYVPNGTTSNSITGTRAQNITSVVAGRPAGNNVINTETYLILVYRRSFTVNEYRAFSKNVGQIFLPESRPIFAADGAGSTLNASAPGSGLASGSAALSAQVALAAVGVSVASGTAQSSVSIPLSASGLSVSDGSANTTATVTLSAFGLAQAAGLAGVSTSVLLAGAAAALASGNAALSAQINALASGSAQAGGNANLTGWAPGALSALGESASSGQGMLTINVQLQAAGVGLSNGLANGQASPPGSVSASGSGQAAGAAIATITAALTAAGFVQAMGAGYLLIDVPLSSFGSSHASGIAYLGMTGNNHHYVIGCGIKLAAEISASHRLATRINAEVCRV